MKSQPDPDQLEITLLGRGVGESCVVHLGDGEWMIVDSFLEAKVPAARLYLDAMGVPRDAISVIVISHFHADHYRGVHLLHDYFSDARLMITEALAAPHFLSLYNDLNDRPFLDQLPSTLKRAGQRVVGAVTPGLRRLKAGTYVHRGELCEVLALSPTEAAVAESDRGLAQAIASLDRTVVTSRLRDDNRCSVVLHVAASWGAGLLCADLVADTNDLGWRAILDEPTNHNLDKAQLVKAPHHGSANADDPAMWKELVDGDPTITVAPYWPSSLPSPADCTRLCARGDLWQAAPSLSYHDDEFGNRISDPPRTGAVRARRRPGESTWAIEVDGPAFHVTA